MSAGVVLGPQQDISDRVLSDRMIAGRQGERCGFPSFPPIPLARLAVGRRAGDGELMIINMAEITARRRKGHGINPTL